MEIRRIILPATTRIDVAGVLESAYPLEGCGVLVGSAAGSSVRVCRAIACENIHPHANDRDRYQIDPRELLRIDRDASADGQSVVGVFHSHPDHPPVPSAVDLELAFPGLIYLIGSVSAGRLGIIRAWVVCEMSRGFVEVEVIGAPDS